MIKYNVSVNWLDFEFDNDYKAMYFATEAAKHIVKDTPRVSIEFKITEEEEEEEEEIFEVEEDEEEEDEADEENS